MLKKKTNKKTTELLIMKKKNMKLTACMYIRVTLNRNASWGGGGGLAF